MTAALASPPSSAAPLMRQLRDHLDAEIGIHRTLLALAEAKQRDIVAGNMPAFTAGLEKEQPPIQQAAALRQVRDRLLRALGTLAGVADPRLSQLLDLADAQLRHELVMRQSALRELLERLRVINDRNLLLIRQSLSLVRDIVHAVVGGEETHPDAYDRRGRNGDAPMGRGRVVDYRS